MTEKFDKLKTKDIITKGCKGDEKKKKHTHGQSENKRIAYNKWNPIPKSCMDMEKIYLKLWKKNQSEYFRVGVVILNKMNNIINNTII